MGDGAQDRYSDHPAVRARRARLSPGGGHPHQPAEDHDFDGDLWRLVRGEILPAEGWTAEDVEAHVRGEARRVLEEILPGLTAPLRADMESARAEAARARGALEKIIAMQPCLDAGGCFYPRHGHEGEYLGEEPVDPISVIGGMASAAAEGLGAPAEGLPPLPAPSLRDFAEDRGLDLEVVPTGPRGWLARIREARYDHGRRAQAPGTTPADALDLLARRLSGRALSVGGGCAGAMTIDVPALAFAQDNDPADGVFPPQRAAGEAPAPPARQDHRR